MAPANLFAPLLGTHVPLGLACLALAVALYVTYRSGFPKPIPGIPYNVEAAKRFLGDLPEIQAARHHGPGLRPWMIEMSHKHNSPIVQFFLKPWNKPFIILCDYWAAHDIVLRRGKEFDRSKRTVECFGTLVPEHRLCMLSTDPRLKRNRELTKDLMTPAFLNQVSAPLIHEIAGSLVDLWRLKLRLSGGRPFSGQEDMHMVAMDMILAASFGFGEDRRMVNSLIGTLESKESVAKDDNAVSAMEDEFMFPSFKMPEDFEALQFVGDTLGFALSSAFPGPSHWLMRKLNLHWRKQFAIKERFIDVEIHKAVDRVMRARADGQSKLHCAMDEMLIREINLAKKEGREPDFLTAHMRDESFGYIVGGHDTTSRTLAWTIKYLADNPAAQRRLRAQLRAAYPSALSEARDPTAAEITRARAPYLDAAIEEFLRATDTLALAVRQATCDTTILGRPVPRGATVMICTRGPSLFQPALRAPWGKEGGGEEGALVQPERETTVGSWDPETVEEFRPERWLKRTTGVPPPSPRDGSAEPGRAAAAAVEEVLASERPDYDDLEFDSQAGPFLTFGGGPRGCFGRRLAYLEMRIVLVMLLWNFELLPCDPVLSSYDGIEGLTTKPKQSYVKLRELGGKD